MAFAAMHVVTAKPDEIADVLAEVQQLGYSSLAGYAGFRHGRVYCSEDNTQVVVISEWDSREHFAAYRQTEAGRRVSSEGVRWHPKSTFYQIVAE